MRAAWPGRRPCLPAAAALVAAAVHRRRPLPAAPTGGTAVTSPHAEVETARTSLTTVDSRLIAPLGVAAPARWPMWAVSVAFGWSLFYVALGCYWVFGGAGFLFGRNDANGPDAGSLL